MNMLKNSLFAGTAMLALIGVAAAPASAQDTAAAPDNVEDEVESDVIVIEALNPTHVVNVGAFGSKDPLDVPLSIESYGELDMDNMRARTISDVLRNDPSIAEAAVGGSYDHIRIRGFAIDWANTLRVEGLSLSPYQDVPLENIERVDLLKGPSGFLYGFNSPGGTVNYIIKRPTANPFLSLGGEIRQYNGHYLNLDTSNVIGSDEAIGYRVNLAYEDVGDFTDNGDIQRYFGGLALDFRLGEKAVLQLNGDFQHKGVAAQPVIGLQPNGDLPPEVDEHELLGQPWLQYVANAYNIGARLDYTLNDDWFIVAQINNSINNRDAAFVDIITVAANGDILDGDYVLSKGQEYDTISSQLFASGNFDTGPIGHEMVAGLSARFYKALEGGYFFDTLTVENIFDPVYSPEPASIPTLAKNRAKNRQLSAFFSDFITLSPQWQVLVGGRYIKYYSRRQLAGSATRTIDRQNSFVPSVGLMFKPNNDVTFYASYAQGLEQGGFAPPQAVNSGERLGPIKSIQYEAGAKARFGGLTVSGAVFQINKGLEFTNAQNVYVQDGRQRHRGVELSVDGRITDDLKVIAGAAYLDTKQLKTIDPSTRGKHSVDAPKWQGSVYADYRLPFADALYANVGVYYQGDRWLDPQNTAQAPDYVRVDTGLRYAFAVGEQEVELRANVKNVFNEFYWVAADIFYPGVYPGMPRTFYLSGQITF